MGDAQSTFVIDAKIRRIAARQLGVITVHQAERIGIDRAALARRRESGALVPLFRGALRLAPFATTPLQRALAASLLVRGSVITATSAAIVHGLPLPSRHGAGTDPAVLSVPAGRVVRVPGVDVIREGVALPHSRWMTTQVATPAATLLHLPRYLDDALVERCLDHLLAHRLASVDGLRALVGATSVRAVRGRRLLLGLLEDRGDGIGHRSAQEQRVARWLTRAGLTGWTRNLRVGVGGARRVEVDFGWRGARLALEVSPFFTHGSRTKQERDAERRRLLVVGAWRVVEALDRDLADERAFTRTVISLRALGAT